MKNNVSSLEILEARIAPAAAVATFLDTDGDNVTIAVVSPGDSDVILKTALDTALLKPGTYLLGSVGLQLATLDLTDSAFAGASVKITAERSSMGGDGLVAVGYIKAGSQPLGNVVVEGDLGKFTSLKSVNKLKVASLGRYGTLTGAPDVNSSINLGLGILEVKEDISSASLSSDDGGIQTVTIGGSLLGGTEVNSGSIRVAFIDAMTVGGRIESGTGNKSGEVSVFGGIGSLKIAGSLIGKKDATFDPNGGQISAGGDIGLLKIGGDLLATGSNGYNEAQVAAGGKITTVKIGGSVRGGASQQGSISGVAGIDFVTIGGDLESTDPSVDTGAIYSLGRIGSVTIGGSILGGKVRGATLGTILVTHDLQGGDFQNSGTIISTAAGTADLIRIGGSLLGGTVATTGNIFLSPDTVATKIVVRGDIHSTLLNTGSISGGNLLNVVVGGSIYSSTTGNTAVKQIAAAGNLGMLTVKGSLIGNVTNPVNLDLGTGETTFVKVLGRTERATIFKSKGTAILDKIKVGGTWTASRLAVGTAPGADNLYGTSDDTLLAGASSIGIVKIGGQAFGSLEDADNFRIITRDITTVFVAGELFPYDSGMGKSTFFGLTGDFVIVDAA